jgi:hypothetical protein
MEASSDNGLEAKHWLDPLPDSAELLLKLIIRIGTLPDPDRLQFAFRPVLEPTCCAARQDRFPVRLAPVNHDPLRQTISFDRPRRKRLAAVKLRLSLNQNSTVSPLLSIARYKYIHCPRILI